MSSSYPVVTVDNCDREPIHIPGLIQSHGVLFAFDGSGRCVWRSANAEAMLGERVPDLGEPLGAQHFGGVALVQACLDEGRKLLGQPPGELLRRRMVLGDQTTELIVHQNGRLVILEFELTDPEAGSGAAFAEAAHRSLGHLRRHGSVSELLQAAVREVRALTGFDRVMAYQFRHDASGDVVAEDRRADLEPYLNRRYPAGDIPAQARRLYVVSTLRLIVDAGSKPAALEGIDSVPLDMSWCTLRSVSPIHIEYLSNIGVSASMSVSIVIGGQLWGMIACHHLTPRHVPLAVRMTCDVMAQLLASSIQTLLLADHAAQVNRGSDLRLALIGQVMVGEGPLDAMRGMLPLMLETFGADALVACQDNALLVEGAVPADGVTRLLAWLQSGEGMQHTDAGVLALNSLTGCPSDLAAALMGWAGVLAVRTDDFAPDFLVLMRREQIETVQWGGRPEKTYTVGPNGPRLTPRGSFDVWKEIVRGTSVPWTTAQVDTARHIRAELLRASSARRVEIGKAREQMLAVLGHDLRNPLQTISMAAHVLEHGSETSAKLGARIRQSSSRMGRLIAEVLDASRLQTGLGLGIHRRPADLAHIVRESVQEAQLAYPGIRFDLDLPPQAPAEVDGDRLAQLLDNLIGNARQHSQPGEPIRVELAQGEGRVCLRVINSAPPIAQDVAARLFEPYKQQSVGNERNRGGLGLGLYVASEIARSHDGELRYRWESGCVVFELDFPQHTSR